MKVIKMHGLGNDFCMIPYEEKKDYPALARKMCDRHTGIGGDGMIVVKTNPVEMLFYNADGSRAPMCGNGIRCFSKYCYELGLFKRNKLDVLTGAGMLTIELVNENPFRCMVNMGKPIFNNSMLNVSDDLDFFGRTIDVLGKKLTVYAFFMGTVHTVVYVNSFEDEILKYAEAICHHSLFTKDTNVNFVRVIDRDTIAVKTFERGVGWTKACGTGCCASVVASQKLGYTKTKVKALLELGHLDIEVTRKGYITMAGPAETVFSCEFKEEN